MKRESPPVQINDIYSNLHDITCRLSPCKTRVYLVEGLDGGGVWNSLISKNLAHYSLSLKFLLIL